MKTVFKEGMEVYDQLNFPNKKGVIVEISNEENDPYPVEVSFENEAGRNNYTPDGRFSKKHIPTLSTKPYEIVLEGFEQKAPPPTFEKAEKKLKYDRDKYAYFDLAGRNILYPKSVSPEVFEALRQLVILRDYYNEGWKPKNNSYVHIITTRNGELVKDCLMGDFRVLYFESKEIRNTFFEDQRELLEIAKPLL